MMVRDCFILYPAFLRGIEIDWSGLVSSHCNGASSDCHRKRRRVFIVNQYFLLNKYVLSHLQYQFNLTHILFQGT